MQQPTYITTDHFSGLYSQSNVEKSGLFFEMTTGNLILEPVPRWTDFGSDVAPHTANGKWEEVTDPTTGKKRSSQFSAAYDADNDSNNEWAIETSATDFLSVNSCFCVDLNIGPPPEALTFRDEANYYRRVVWSLHRGRDGTYGYLAGHTTFRVTFAYGLPPKLQKTTDGGFTWSEVGRIETPVDLSKLTKGENVSGTLTVMTIDGHLLVWFGGGMNRAALACPLTEDVASGPLRIEGKNGIGDFGFAHLRFKTSGYYVSLPLPAPRNFKTARPSFTVAGSVLPQYHSFSGEVETRDTRAYEFTYRLSLGSVPLSDNPEDEESAYSITTPIVKACSVIWPPSFVPPPSSGYRDVNVTSALLQLQEMQDWNPYTGLRTRGFVATMDNTLAQWRDIQGAQVIEAFMGYAHTGVFSRGKGIGNLGSKHGSNPATSDFSFECEDLMAVLAEDKKFLKDRIFPSRWCVYALARLLLQHGGIVPSLTRTLPQCPYGPDPSCPHTKYPSHPGWEPLTPVLQCLREVRDVEGAIFGQDAEGQFRFQAFDWERERRKRPVARYQMGAEASFGLGGGAVNEITSLTRIRDLRNIRNDITLIGYRQDTGGAFALHDEEPNSKYNRLSPNHLGFTAELAHEWTGYSTPEFMAFALAKMTPWAYLPSEGVEFTALGQPTVMPGDVVEVLDTRSLGPYYVRYMVTNMVSTWQPGSYTSTIQGIWTAAGSPPGGY